jgi:hypothetical protein
MDHWSIAGGTDVALQGTIDAFPLTDVLHLLSTSERSGRLVLDGDRGTATLWLEGGRVIGGGPRVSAGSPAPSLVLEMLRFRDGSFVFDAAPAGEGPEVAVDATPLEECIASAAALHEQWSAIEAVVPSGAHVIRLGTPLSFPVAVDEGDWQLIAAAADRSSVDALAERLGMDEYEAAAAVAALVGRGLLVVEEPARSLSPPALPVRRDEPQPAPRAVEPRAAEQEPPTPALTPEMPTEIPARPAAPATRATTEDSGEPAAFPDRFPIDDLLGVDDGDVVDPWISNGVDLTAEIAAGERATPFADRLPPTYDRTPVSDTAWDELIDDALDAAEPDESDAVEPRGGSADEVLRQMSRLSPQAAEAIAAALHSGAGRTGEDVEDEAGGASFLGTRG